MPNTKKVTTKTPDKKSSRSIVTQSTIETPGLQFSAERVMSFVGNYRPIFTNRKTYLIILVLGLLLLAYYKKNWFIAATVNGSPVTNFELLFQMNAQFKEQTLSQMINEKLILQEARKNNIVITQTDINQKIADIEKSVGGPQILDSLLSQQGQTRDSVKDQMRYLLIRDKLYENEATVSTQEVQDFIDQNNSQMKATESAEQTKEATDIIKQQKIGQLFNEKFANIKKEAKINIF